MSLKDLEPGVYQAFPVSWGVVEVELKKKDDDGEVISIDKVLAAQIEFNLVDSPETQVKWSEFFLRKDGCHNQKVDIALKACGFKSSDLADFVDPDAIDTAMPVLLTVIIEKGYKKIGWVNGLQGGAKEEKGKKEEYIEAKEAKKMLKNLNLNEALAEIAGKKQTTPVPKPSARPKPKNYAPQGDIPAPPATDDDFPF